MNQDRILVVEDNPLNQKLVTRFLEAKGFQLVVASNTQEAEAYLAKNHPRLILMDVSLPGEDGLSLVRRIRRQDPRDIRIVALTAHAMPGDREVALAAGCNGYLTKPVELRELLAAVQEHLRPAEARP